MGFTKKTFNKELKSYPNIKIDFIETNLTPMTAALARGYDAVCAFVNADAGAMTSRDSGRLWRQASAPHAALALMPSTFLLPRTLA